MREVLSVISRLAKAKGISTPYIVGGLPRDKTMGKTENIDDVDITTGTEKSNYLSKWVYYYIKKSHPDATFKEMNDGHTTINVNDIKLDFSSNFVSPHAEDLLKKAGIQNPTSLQKEMFSRDFTCNTLLLTMDLKKILDPTTMGLKDIKDKILRTPFPPEITLSDDNKRIVRIIYLAAKLDFNVEPDIINWVRKNKNAINNSKEKYVKDKLRKASEYNMKKTVDLLTRMGLLNIAPLPDEILVYLRGGQ